MKRPRRPVELVIARRARLVIAAQARLNFPEECCGLLVGKLRAGRARVTQAVPAANVAPRAQRRRRFEIDPGVLFAVQRALREGAAKPHRDVVLGYFHSHPRGKPEPSGADLAGAHEPGFVMLIAAPPHKAGAVPLRAWLRLGLGPSRRFRPLRLTIER
ncbi:M67 family metallopeptidase [Parvibaculum sp.]|uniref:M67 family metallopeptidase n=1 Tax=Parvibaculum sp. TaxID=2024848 RepID=UPI00320DEDC3